MRAYAETNTYEAIGTTLATPSTTMASGLAQMLAPQGGYSVRHRAYDFFGDARRISYEVRRPERGMCRAYALCDWRSANFFA